MNWSTGHGRAREADDEAPILIRENLQRFLETLQLWSFCCFLICFMQYDRAAALRTINHLVGKFRSLLTRITFGDLSLLFPPPKKEVTFASLSLSLTNSLSIPSTFSYEFGQPRVSFSFHENVARERMALIWIFVFQCFYDFVSCFRTWLCLRFRWMLQDLPSQSIRGKW